MDISSFIEAFSGASSEDELTKQIGKLSQAMGLGQFRMAVIIPQSLQRPHVAIFSSCSEEWVDLYSRENLLQRDPIIHMSMRQSSPIFWDRGVSCTPDLPPGAMEVMDMASGFGLRNGVSFPLRGASGEVGILSFITSEPGGGLIMEASPLLRLLADYILEAAIRIVRVRLQVPALTRRELDCLFWVSEGKNQDEIAAILGITTRTVAHHMRLAIQKTNSTNRDQAAVKSVIRGLIIPNLNLIRVEDFCAKVAPGL